MATKKDIVGEAEFQDILKRLESCFDQARLNLVASVTYLAKLTRPQLRRVQQKFSWLDRGLIYRLHLLGNGWMPEHLAVKLKSISGNYYMRLPDSAKAVLANPDAPLDILMANVPGGVKTKTVAECTGFDLRQVTDEKLGILTPDQQARKLLGGPVKGKIDLQDCEDEESIRVIDNKWIVIVGSRGGKIKVSLANLRRRFGRS